MPVPSNIIWDHLKPGTNLFLWLFAVLSVNVWLKLLIKMGVTERFGPNFKVIIVMFGDMASFYVLWFIVLMALTSLACSVFIDLGDYANFYTALNMHFDFSLGNFDNSVYCNFEEANADAVAAGELEEGELTSQ